MREEVPPSCAGPGRCLLPGPGGGEECHQLKAGVWGPLAGETAPRRWGSEPDSRIHLSRRPGLWKQCPRLCETRERTLNVYTGCTNSPDACMGTGRGRTHSERVRTVPFLRRFTLCTCYLFYDGVFGNLACCAGVSLEQWSMWLRI